MTERLSLDEYRRAMGLIEATDPKPTRRRDTRWRDELHRHLVMHPELRNYRMVAEHQFHETRKWRFDFAYPDELLGIEVEGIVNAGEKSRHTTWAGYTEDCIKYSEAAVLGWRLIRVTQEMVKSGMAIWLIERGLKA